ncbi:MAG: DUF3604 domain-containing protein, partial [Pseudomonadales bacterium]|nr:DUF3604 domain-containing protein [Pseudomonadales bacterium]
MGKRSSLVAITIAGVAATATFTQVYAAHHASNDYSPYVAKPHPQNVYWGDTHLHTSFSMDAGAFGNRLGPEKAYEFARGDEVVASMGQKARLVRPLDFLVVADHSDNMGFFPDMFEGKAHILSDAKGKEWHDRVKSGDGASVAMEIIGLFSQGEFPESLMYFPDSKPYRNAWDRTLDAAEKYNEPGQFTAFIGYEWTSLIKGNNMHRVVVYRDGIDKGKQMVPYTTYPPQGSPNPRDLWKWMANYEDKTGGNVLAIAHNGNLANGIMFPLGAQYDGRKLDEEYVSQRAQWEPIYEITQIKGDGEAHPVLSPNDEFADYETWDFGNLDYSEAKTDSMLGGEYGREALKRGLKLEERFGVNPYKMGLIGSTDSHTSLATAKEDNYFGKASSMEPSKERMEHPFFKTEAGTIYYRQTTASGLAAVWANENTRESLFDAMERKEVYATTGSRMTVRLFAGWDFAKGDVDQADFVNIGYEKGVPMGGDLKKTAKASAPQLMVHALKDPDGGNLDRVQIIKGWLDNKGNL